MLQNAIFIKNFGYFIDSAVIFFSLFQSFFPGNQAKNQQF